MAAAARYFNEFRQAKRMSCSLADFFRLASTTALFHLGNKVAFFNSNRPRRIRCVCNGRCLEVQFRQNAGDVAVLYEILGAGIYNAPYDSLEQVRTIVDLGAHIGLATLYFAAFFPRAKLISVEPMPDNFELLRKNCLTNGVYATLVNKAIGSRTGEVDLHRNLSSHMHTLVRGAPQVSRASVRVDMVAMSDLLDSNAVDEVDILKVDIEGAESELFAECKSWISKVRLIIIEVHPGLVDYPGVIRSITTHGFEYFPPGSFAPTYDIFLREDVAREVRHPGQASS